MCNDDLIVIPTIRWVGHPRFLGHYVPDGFLDGERNALASDESDSATLLRRRGRLACRASNC